MLRSIRKRLQGRELARESAWSMVKEIITLCSMMLTFLLLGRTLGPGLYGGYVAVYAIVAPAVTYASGGVVLTLLQHIVRDHDDIVETVRGCITMTLCAGGVLVGLGLWLSSIVAPDVSPAVAAAILGAEFLVVPLIQIAAAVVQTQRSYVGTAQILAAVAAVRAVSVAALHAFGRLSLVNFVTTVLVGTSVLAVFVIISVSRTFDLRFVPGRVGMALVKTNVAYSVSISGASLNNDGDKLVLSGYGYRAETGLYGVATRLIGLGLIPVSAVVQASHRRFLDHDPNARGEHLHRALRFSKSALMYAFVWFVVLLVLAPQLTILMGDEFAGSVDMVRWLAPVVLLRSVGVFPVNALMGLGYVSLRSAVIVGNALVALALYIAIIPTYGWKGAVIATIASESVEAVLLWTLVVVLQRRHDRRLSHLEAT